MPKLRWTEEPLVDPNDSDADQPLHVVVAYDDIAARRRALRALGDVARGLADGTDFEPRLCSFDRLASLHWRDVADAEILVISTSSPHPLPEPVEGWVKASIEQKRGTTAAIVALFGPEDHPDDAGSPRLLALQAEARQAGLDFFAPLPSRPGPPFGEAIARIHERAELVTPVLDGILHRSAPLPAWAGISVAPRGPRAGDQGRQPTSAS